MQTVAVIGAALDLGAGRRGVDMGPSAIRYAGLVLCSLDVVEVNPVLDAANATGSLAVELVASALGAKIL